MKIKRARYIGDTRFLGPEHNKVYDILSVERKWFRIIDSSGEDYLYPPQLFDNIEYEEDEEMVTTPK